jgi:hypothetical protein
MPKMVEHCAVRQVLTGVWREKSLFGRNFVIGKRKRKEGGRSHRSLRYNTLFTLSYFGE